MPLELPDANRVKPEDPNYISYLDESITLLDRMGCARKEKIIQCGCADAAELIQEISEIAGRHMEFIEKALEFVEETTVYEPDEVPTHAYLLCEVGGCFIYSAKSDFRLKSLVHPDRKIIFDSRAEMESDEGIEKVLNGETDASIHAVSSPVHSVPIYPHVLSYAARKVHKMMESKHPLFGEVNSPPQQSCHMCSPASAFLEIIKGIGAAIFSGHGPLISPAERCARRYRHLTAPMKKNDPRLS